MRKDGPKHGKDGLNASPAKDKADWKRDDSGVPSSGPQDRQINISIGMLACTVRNYWARNGGVSPAFLAWKPNQTLHF